MKNTSIKQTTTPTIDPYLLYISLLLWNGNKYSVHSFPIDLCWRLNMEEDENVPSIIKRLCQFVRQNPAFSNWPVRILEQIYCLWCFVSGTLHSSGNVRGNVCVWGQSVMVSLYFEPYPKPFYSTALKSESAAQKLRTFLFDSLTQKTN